MAAHFVLDEGAVFEDREIPVTGIAGEGLGHGGVASALADQSQQQWQQQQWVLRHGLFSLVNGRFVF